MIPMIIKTKARLKDIIAEIFPLWNAVKNPDANIFIPTNKKANANIFNPCKASLNTVLSGFTKTLTINGANTKAIINTKREEININFRECLNVSINGDTPLISYNFGAENSDKL